VKNQIGGDAHPDIARAEYAYLPEFHLKMPFDSRCGNACAAREAPQASM
jgi:hypothetical protein